MKKAFTVPELLVSVVVIGIILALLFPALGRVREGVRRAQCMNNLRQHGIAWYLYLDDHEECFPAYWGVPSDIRCDIFTFGGKSGGSTPYSWYTADRRTLNRYLDVDNTSSADIFYCPDDIKPVRWQNNQTTFNCFGNSYAANIFILRYVSGRRPLSTITSPSNKVYLEACYRWNIPGHGGKGSNDAKAMVLFVDGHVAGPFLHNEDFENYLPNTNKPVIKDPNGTASPID